MASLDTTYRIIVKTINAFDQDPLGKINTISAVCSDKGSS